MRRSLDRRMEYASVSRRPPAPAPVAAPAVHDIPSRIRGYLECRLPGARALELDDMQRIAVGWSHETWLFEARWREAGERRSQGYCLRRDPGNALLRHLSDLGEQFRVLECLDATPLPTPKPFWYEADPAVLGAPFLVMERVPGSCPNPWGREGRAFYRAAAERGTLPRSFTDALTTLHTLDWRAAGLAFLGVPAARDQRVRAQGNPEVARACRRFRARARTGADRPHLLAGRRTRPGPTASPWCTAPTAPATC